MAIHLSTPHTRDESCLARKAGGVRAVSLTALSAVLLVMAFPHIDAGWLAWVALVPFLIALRACKLGAALAHGVLLGLLFFGGLLYWIGVFAAHVVGPGLAVVVLVGVAISQALTVVLFAGFAYGLGRLPSVWAWRLGIPALWCVLEWTRQLGPFGMGWGDLAYTQHSALPMLQLTKLAGVWGVSFVIVLVNVALAETIMRAKVTRWPIAVAGLVAAILVFGEATLLTENFQPTYRAAALQANINQNVSQNPAYTRHVLQTFAQLGQKAAAQGVVLAVWPETGCPGYLRANHSLLLPISSEARAAHQTTLVGSMDIAMGATKASNTLFCVSPDGQISGEYSKQHLVPFGEYVPFRKQLPWLERLHLSIYDMAPGGGRQPLMQAVDPIGKIGAAICYDSTYGSLMRSESARGANILVVSTDDTWFGRTAAARQHTAMAAIRAAENDRCLVRCAATGVSQIIAPSGKVLAEAPLFTRAVVSAPVQSRSTRTLYCAWGDWFVAAAGLMLSALVLISVRDRGTSRSSGR